MANVLGYVALKIVTLGGTLLTRLRGGRNSLLRFRLGEELLPVRLGDELLPVRAAIAAVAQLGSRRMNCSGPEEALESLLLEDPFARAKGIALRVMLSQEWMGDPSETEPVRQAIERVRGHPQVREASARIKEIESCAKVVRDSLEAELQGVTSRLPRQSVPLPTPQSIEDLIAAEDLAKERAVLDKELAALLETKRWLELLVGLRISEAGAGLRAEGACRDCWPATLEQFARGWKWSGRAAEG